MQLRPYQSNIITKTYDAIRSGARHVLICLPTGGGKTAISSEIVRRCFEKGNRSIFCVHRQELMAQTFQTYVKNGLSPALIKAGAREHAENPCQIAMITTLVNRLERYPKEDVLIMDEAHHQASNTWAKVADFYKNAVIIGLSATPCRLDGKPLNKFFDVMVEETTTKQLIKDGYLVPYQYFAPSEIDESGLVLGSNGEYTRESVEAVIKTSAVIGNNIKTYKELCYGKRNVVFAVNRKHAEAVCAEYNKAGIPAEMLDGTCSDRERKETLARFGKNETKVLVNVDLFGEGFDLPAIEVVSLLRPTHSTALYLQQVGRALRTCPEIGKTQAIILDHVNNYKRHGFPDDERQWSLDGKIRTTKSEESLVRIKRCPVCFFAHPPALVCPNCGYEYQSDGRTIEEINGKLVMIGSSEYKEERKIEVIKAKSLTELVQIEKDRGYKKYWAEKQWQLKTGENLWSSVNGLKKIEDARGYRKGWCWVHKARRK